MNEHSGEAYACKGSEERGCEDVSYDRQLTNEDWNEDQHEATDKDVMAQAIEDSVAYNTPSPLVDKLNWNSFERPESNEDRKNQQ